MSYDVATRTLTWTAATVTVDGSVSYKTTVDVKASEIQQPLHNFATITSDQTQLDDARSDVYVPVIPLAESDRPSAPPTDVLEPTEMSPSGSSLPLILAILGILVLVVAFVTPVPATARRRNRR